jgi:hypothetical protein
MRVCLDRWRGRRKERGVSLLVVAGALVMLFGIAALAIDLASLYVARNEAQRAADAAALAAAKAFADSGCVGGGTCASVQTLATQQAIGVGGQNLIAGQAAAIQSGDVTFTLTPTQNPRVTVAVARTSARGNAVPTFFARAIGIRTANITATATAEAFSPSGDSGNTIFCTTCVRPWAVGNCDSAHTTPLNSICTGTQASFLDPNNNYAVSNPGATPAGVIGGSINIRASSAPSEFGSVDYGGGTAGYTNAIQVCPTIQFTCGNTISTLPGNRGNPTATAVESLIHASNSGLGQGQDKIDTTVSPPVIRAGSSNPLVLNGVITAGTAITTSDSLMTAFVYDGHTLKPGKETLTIVGFMQLFITQVDSNNDIPGVIMNLAGCGNNPQPNGTCSSSSGTVSGGGGSLIPIRLVRNP